MNLIKLTKSTGNENHKNDQEHGSIDELFKEMDLNEDGSISLVEFKEIYKNIVGKNLKAELPKSPDIIIKNDFTNSLNKLSEELLRKIKIKI